MAQMSSECEVCRGVSKLLYTVTRCGLDVSYLERMTYSGMAKACPECGREIKDERVREAPEGTGQGRDINRP